MEIIRGSVSREMDGDELKERTAGFGRVLLDLGTGDGRYVRRWAERRPDWFAIGVDASRENLREHSRARLSNLLFIISGAQVLPRELAGMASRLTINFPWGSLLDGLLMADSAVLDGIAALARRGAALELCLNAGALAEFGRTLYAGADRIRENLIRCGWLVDVPRMLDTAALRALPSTWARRIAVGRDPRALMLSAALLHRVPKAEPIHALALA